MLFLHYHKLLQLLTVLWEPQDSNRKFSQLACNSGHLNKFWYHPPVVPVKQYLTSQWRGGLHLRILLSVLL